MNVESDVDTYPFYVLTLLFFPIFPFIISSSVFLKRKLIGFKLASSVLEIVVIFPFQVST